MFRRTVAAVSSGLLAATILTVTAPHAGGAERVTGVVLQDGPGDVFRTDSSEEGPGIPAPKASRVDIVRVVVQHRTHAVTFRLRVRNFRPALRHDLQNVIDFSIKRSSGRELLADVDFIGRRRTGTIGLFTATGSGTHLACPGARVHSNFASNVMRVRIPRSCLGHPRWVRVDVQNFIQWRKKNFDQFIFVDNANDHADHVDELVITQQPYTQRLYRG